MNVRRSAISVVTAALLLSATPAFAGNGQNLLQYVPQGSAVVVNVNLEQLRGLPLYQMIWGAVTASAEAQEVLTELQTQAGFNPNTDLNGILIALSPEDTEKWAVLVEGNFNVAQITTYLATQTEEVATQQYQSHTVYYDPTEPEADRSYFSFLNDNTVAAGTQAELSAVLDAVAGTGSSVSTNAAMSPLLSSVDASGAFWFAGVMTPSMQADMVGSPMEGVTTMQGNGNFNSGFNVDYSLGTGTPEQATALAAFLNEQIAQARTAPEVAQMGLAGVLDGVVIAAAANVVSVTAAIPEQTLNQLIGVISALMAAQAGQGAAAPY